MRSTGAAEPAPTAGNPKTLPAARAEPSWGQVVATTVSLWLSRRMPGPRADRRRRGGLRRPCWHLSHRAARGLWLITLVLALAAIAVTVLRFSGTSTATARSASPGRTHPARAGQDAAVQARAQAARAQAARAQAARAQAARAQAARAQAAGWIAGQVSSDEIIACDPAVCAALRAHGVAAARLLPVGPATPGSAGSAGSAGLSGAGVIVASASIRSRFGPRLSDEYAPVLLASFGSGASLIEVRAAFPGGGLAAYNSAVRADAAARQSAGAQLLRSQRIMVSPQGAAQLRAGEVDSRLLVMLAALASLQRLRVVAFGDASPAAQVPPADLPLREVTITSAGGRGGAAGLAPILTMVRAQRATYQPALASIVHPAAGQAELLIEFGAPSPLGLLEGGN